jgi:hypothetical protein
MFDKIINSDNDLQSALNEYNKRRVNFALRINGDKEKLKILLYNATCASLISFSGKAESFIEKSTLPDASQIIILEYIKNESEWLVSQQKYLKKEKLDLNDDAQFQVIADYKASNTVIGLLLDRVSKRLDALMNNLETDEEHSTDKSGAHQGDDGTNINNNAAKPTTKDNKKAYSKVEEETKDNNCCPCSCIIL